MDLESTNLALGPPEGTSRFDWGMKWVHRVVGLPALGYGIYGLVGDCKEYDKDGNPIDGNKCVGNSIWTAVATVMCIHGYGEWAIEIGSSLQQYAIQRSGEMLGEAWNDFTAYGPFRRPEEPFPMPPALKARGADVLKRAEESFTNSTGLEIRHIGLWNGLMPGETAKRDEREKSIPVFAFRRENQDFHAAYMGEHAPGQGDRFRVGIGPGPRTEINEHRLKARQADDEDGNYNSQFFDRGGLDVFGKTSDENESPGLDPEEDLQWLHGEVVCTLDAEGPGSDYPGLWWGVMDHEKKSTFSSGGVAAFYPGHPSIIGYIKHEGHLNPKDDCTVDDPFR